jgi:D-alanyl-D-alanine-carboxypeptidase/D-alanyl-D-alanine-endopeptidase
MQKALFMRRFAFLVACISGITFAPSAHAQTVDWKSRIDEIAQQRIADERNVGIAIGVIKDGETWIRGYGSVRVGDSASPTADTIFEIGSISKVFTGLALGQLAVTGKLSLEDPLEKHLPELSSLPAGRITFRELTTHTSGLPRLPSNLNPQDLQNPYKDYHLANLLLFLKSFQFAQPGPFSFDYSNLGAGLLGYALSRVAGMDYDALIRDFIVRPLSMKDTGVALTAAQLQKTAQGYTSGLDAAPLWDLAILAGAGGMRSSLEDLLVFLKANLSPDSTPLSAAIRMSHQGLEPALGGRVGLGWFLDGADEDAMVWHNGRTGGFHSLVAFKPKERAGIVMLTNTASSMACLSALVFGKDCEPKKEFIHSDAQLRSFVGEYQLTANTPLNVTRSSNSLLVQVTGQGKLRMIAESEGRFDVEEGLAQIAFQKNAAGAVDRLLLIEDGSEYLAKKVTQVENHAPF